MSRVDGEANDDAAGRVVDKGMPRVLGVALRRQAEIASEEIVRAGTPAEAAVIHDPLSGPILDDLLADRPGTKYI